MQNLANTPIREIVRRMGYEDHTTVLHGIRQYKRRLQADGVYRSILCGREFAFDMRALTKEVKDAIELESKMTEQDGRWARLCRNKGKMP